MNKQFIAIVCASLVSLTSSYAQLNDASLGVHIYGATMKDKDGERRWVHFRANNTSKMDRYAPFFMNDEYRLWAVRCGAMTPEYGFVGYMDRIYSNVEYPGYFYRLDIETGEYEVIKDMCNEWDEYNWPVIYDLEWDYSRQKLFGLCRATTEQGYASTAVVEVNPKSGSYQIISQQIGFYALALAIDADGYFYTVSMATTDGEWKDGTNLTKFKLEGNRMQQLWQKRIFVQGENFMINYTNDLTFDHTTGDLYWAADNDDNWQKLIRIDPETGDTYRMGSIGTYESICAMYIPSTFAESRTAPAGVKDVQVSYDDNHMMSLGWTNPSTQWNRQPLASLQGVKVARDAESNVVDDLTSVVAGQTSSYVDNEATDGLHTYYITPYNENGNGIVTTWKAWVGEDTPGSVIMLNAMKVSDEQIDLSWVMPQQGAHEGWFEKEGLTYDVVRMPDNVTVAEGLSECAFSDKNLGLANAYSYVVTAHSTKGTGTPVESNPIVAGKAYSVPFYATFDTQHKCDLWTVIDQNYDGKSWEFEGQYGAADYMRIGMDLGGGARDYLVSPKIHIEEGKTYRMTSNIVINGQTAYFMRLQWSDELNAETFVTFASYQNNIGEYDEQTQHVALEGTFEADFTGDIYLSICNTSEAGIANVGIYDVLFEEVYDYDLAIVGTEQVIEAVAGSTTQMTVTLCNKGKQTVQKNTYRLESYDVETGDVLGEQEGNRLFFVGDEYNFTVPVTFTTSGTRKLAARIVAEQDQDATNNVSEPQVVLVKEGTLDWNVILTEGCNRGDQQTREARVPFDFTYEYSTTQHIYPAEEIGMTGAIYRLGYRYDMNSYFTTENYVVSVSLGVTGKDRYNSKQDWVPFEGQTLVWSGLMTLEGGSGTHIISFDFDTPFILKEGENLVVTIEKKGTSPVMWPIAMDCYNYLTGVFRGLRYSSDYASPFPWGDNAINILEYVPHTLMAIGDASGIETIVDTERNRVKAIYDLQGRRVAGDAHGLIVNGGKIMMVK